MLFRRRGDSDGLDLVPGQTAAAMVAHQRRAQQLAFRHQAESLAKREMSKAEADALGSLTIYCLGQEVSTLNFGEGLAGGRRAVLELTARKVSQHAALNDRNILRWFG